LAVEILKTLIELFVLAMSPKARQQQPHPFEGQRDNQRQKDDNDEEDCLGETLLCQFSFLLLSSQTHHQCHQHWCHYHHHQQEHRHRDHFVVISVESFLAMMKYFLNS
jgi:hypothetical protein